MKYNSDFAYDLKVGQVKEKELGFLLGQEIEVKRDLKAINTGNLFIEYESRDKDSGLVKTTALYYCFFFTDTRMFLILTEDLKTLCRKYIGTSRDVKGGDNNTSKGILLPLKDLITQTKSK